jgi:hypothetical protein
MAMNFALLEIAPVKALLLGRKKFTWIFHFRENRKKPKNPYFGSHSKNGFNGRNFYYT